MRVKCANCGMIYDITSSPMEFRSEMERLSCATCPGCGSNAKDKTGKIQYKRMQEIDND